MRTSAWVIVILGLMAMAGGSLWAAPATSAPATSGPAISTPATSAPARVDEKRLCPLDNEDVSLEASEDLSHYAFYITKPDKTMAVVVDGQPGPAYANIGSLRISPDDSRVAYVARTAGKKCLAVIDGKPGPEYDFVEFNRGSFSADGKHLAYLARKDKARFLIVDGVQKDLPDGAGGTWYFSGDFKHLACYVFKDGKQYMALDGELGPPFLSILDSMGQFSPDSAHFAYAAREGLPKKGLVVLDGKKGPEYDGVGRQWFSPDSRRLAYVAKVGSKECLVVDDKPGPEYDRIIRAAFSPDGQHLAYVASKDKKQSLALDGATAPEPYADHGPLVFSPDGKRLAYTACSGMDHFVVLDGKVATPPRFEPQGIVFSPDSKHWAYNAQDELGWSICYVDGRPGRVYRRTLYSRFDGKGNLEYLGIRDKALYRVKQWIP